MSIKIGSTVWLKTGGPSMSVQHEFWLFNGKVKGWMCAWFDENHKVQQHSFAEDSLTEENPFPSTPLLGAV